MSSGELSPSLYARTDFQKYASGLRTCRNFIVQRFGGCANRTGFRYIEATKNNGAAQLIEWIFDADQTYVLEFGDQYMRVYQDGGQVIVSGVVAWVTSHAYLVGDLASNAGTNYYCTTAHTSGSTTRPGVGANWQSDWYALTGVVYEIPTPYLIADLIDTPLQFVQSSDVLTLVHPNYPPRELDRLGNTNWVLSLIVFLPTIGLVNNLVLSGGLSGSIIFYAVTALDAAGREGLPTIVSDVNHYPAVATPSTLTWDIPTGATASGYRVYRSVDGSTYGFIGPAGGVLVPTTDTTWVTSTSTIATTTQGGDVIAADSCEMAVAASSADKALDGVYTVTGQLTTSGAGGAATVVGNVHAFYSRDGEPRVDAGIIFTGNTVYGDFTAVVPFTATVVVPDNGYSTLTLYFVADVVGFAASGTPTFTCEVDTTAGGVSWNKGTIGFTDPLLTQDFSQNPPYNQNLFIGPGNYPSIATYYQQRLLFANTTNLPETVNASRTGDYHNFTITQPVQDDSSVTFTVAGRSFNPVQAMLDLGRLLILTSAGEYTSEGDTSGTLTPTGINLRQQLYQGSASLPPIVIGYAAIYLQARGNVIRDIVRDYYVGFKSNDLTLFATHLFQGYTIVDWAFQQVPGSILWAVRSDGILVSLTYLPDEEVLGWHHHDTDGFVENICVVPEGTEDILYAVIRRTINGQVIRGVERMNERIITPLTDVRTLFYVDSGETYDGRNLTATAMTLSGAAWDGSVLILCTASTSFFSAGDVGNAVFFYDVDGITILVRAVIAVYTSTTVVSVRPQESVPVSLQNIPTTNWARAVETFAGLDHLEGKSVSVYADGYVVASPNNPQYDPPTIVSGGMILLGQPYAVVHVGLPYTSDLQTLDIDTATGASIKPFKQLINRVTLELQDSRGGFVGGAPPTGPNLLNNLDEIKIRDDADGFGPIALRTESYTVNMQNRFNDNGRVFIRQVDPIPLTVLAVIPQGFIPPPA